MDRRHFLCHFSYYLAATAASCGTCRTAFGGMFPGQNDGQLSPDNSMFPDNKSLPQPSRKHELDDSNSERELGDAFHFDGCSLVGNFGLGNSGFNFLASSGDRNFDRLVFEEANILAYVTGMRPSLAFLDDRGAPNAFAAKQDIIAGRSPHGAVALGLNIIRKMLRTGDITAVGAVMVHEWAHIAQFQANVHSRARTVAPTELMADFIAGWFHGFRCAHACQQADPRFAESGLASVGDYNTQDKGHHGTPEQRATAYREGYLFVKSGRGGGIYGFQQFQNQVASFGNPYGGGGFGGGYGQPAQPKSFREAFHYAAQKYI